MSTTIQYLDEAIIVDLAQGLSGGSNAIDTSNRGRAEFSQDASIYTVTPLAVVYPETKEDVVHIVRTAIAHKVPITSRGAGTSIAGNSIGVGIIINFYKYLNKVLEVNPDERWIRVEPGISIGEIQRVTKQHGLRFGPNPSTWNRCSVGGAIGNNACGANTLVYGKTAEQVLELEIIDGHGVIRTISQGLDADPELRKLIKNHLATIRLNLGTFGRQTSGYSLEHLLPEHHENLASAFAGSEGTWGVILEAKVRLVPVPTSPQLLVLGYNNMIEAADDVPNMLTFKPIAVEGIDRRMTERIIAHKGEVAVPKLPSGSAWVMVELDLDEDGKQERILEFIAATNCLDSAVIAPEQISHIWNIRADGSALLSKNAQGEQSWAIWEDAAVPVEHLGSYLTEFEALMEQHGMTGVPYGHLGDGCIHIRIDAQLEHPDENFEQFMLSAARLVAKYKGSLSGEHGDGRLRSALLSEMYPAEIISLFKAVKAYFDPDNMLNPGIIVDPVPFNESIGRGKAPNLLLDGTGFGFEEYGGDFSKAVHSCIGVGRCVSDFTQYGGFMCPSYQATKNEKDSTRGRSRVLGEMLRKEIVTDGWDSPEVMDALDLCLSCKACASDCPAGVDMAKYKSEVLHQKYKHKRRPASHYSFGRLPSWLKLSSKFGSLTNLPLKIRPIEKIFLNVLGADSRRRMPKFPSQSFASWVKKQTPRAVSDEVFTDQTVMLWVDSFSNSIEPKVAQAALAVLQKAGYDVRVVDRNVCCSITWISTGQLTEAKNILEKSAQTLLPLAQQGVPIIGLDHSCTNTLRTDSLDLLGDKDAAVTIAKGLSTFSEFVNANYERFNFSDSHRGKKLVVQPHCHQYSHTGFRADRELFGKLGIETAEAQGCCGMAGNFGMEKGHYDVSVAVAENSLLPLIREQQAEQPEQNYVLSDGFSCRTQVSQLSDAQAISLPELLNS